MRVSFIGSDHFAAAVNGHRVTAQCRISVLRRCTRVAAGTTIGRDGSYKSASSSTGIPHPDLGNFFERRFDKGEILVRYSGVNQRAIVAEDISDLASPDFSGSPAVFEPHAREVAFAFNYWLAPSMVWKTEVDLELPQAGGQLYTFGSAAVPTLSSIGNTANDVAVMTQIAVGF